MLGLPTVCHAQSYSNDRQHPKEYAQDDSQPMRLAAYAISPLGFILEWGITRPIHYVATDTFLAPVFGGEENVRPYTPPLRPLPPEAGAVEPAEEAKLPPSEVSQSSARAPSVTSKPSASKAVSPSSPSTAGQPIIH